MSYRIAGAITMAIALSFPGTVLAQVTPGGDWTFEGYWHEYEEEVDGAFFMENKGPFVSLRYGYNWKSGPAFLRLTPSLAIGSVDYSSAGTGEIDGVFNFTLDGEIRVGAELAVSENSYFVPWTGLGYRMHYDDKGGEVSTLGFFGYDRRSEYVYLPVGFFFSIPLSGDLVLEPEAAYKFLLKGTQTSYLSDFDPACRDLENDQDSGYGVEASLGFRKAISTGGNVTVGPFVRYWDVDDSDIEPIYCGGGIVGAAYEPANTTTEIGVRVRLSF